MTAFEDYGFALRRAQLSGVAAEPEAQLTVPFSNFLIAFTDEMSLGDLQLLREAQLPGVRPDFAAIHAARPCGWVELKAPGHDLDGSRWRGREAKQWEQLSNLDSLIISDGHEAVLYQNGQPISSAALPNANDLQCAPAELASLLRLFFAARPQPIKRTSELASRLAPLAALLRDRITAGLSAPTLRRPIEAAKEAWKTHVHDGVSDEGFANDLAQVVSYAMAITALRGQADRNHDGYISLIEARDALRGPNDMLAAALGPILETRNLLTELAPEIGAIERLSSAVDPVAIARNKDSRGEPWLWFYEDFLAAYDPQARQQTGVYYTPTDVVACQVRLVEQILTQRLNKPLGFGDTGVVTLDPATGSGTYPLTVLDAAAATAEQRRGTAGPAQISGNLAKNLIAFELLPGPYSVAHLRIGQRLADLAGTLTPPQHIRVYLTDTLEDPTAIVPVAGLWGDPAVLAEERRRAARIKQDQPVTVVLGNPPYERRTRESGGGWIVHAQADVQQGLPLFNGLLKAAQRHGVIFSSLASLYNDYIYFWRWAIWKAFEQNPKQPAVVSFITASSWLTGPAFAGLRELIQSLADEVWIIDLGGEGRGALREENIFAIDTPVAIVTLYRRPRASKKVQSEPATIYYRKVTGTAAEKLEHLVDVQPPTDTSDTWHILDADLGMPLVPTNQTAAWTQMPLLTDLFPWQQPGCKYNRTWPIAPSEKVLQKRWTALLEATDSAERAARFVTASSGRNIHTKVTGLSRLSDLLPNSASREIVRYGYRSFDRQWTFEDPRLAKTDSPSLWATRSPKQVFLSSMTTSPLGTGPALTVTTAVPDLHHFSGRGGKDVLPLFRDPGANHPNLPAGLLSVLGTIYGQQVTVEAIAGYVYALLAHPGYQQVFAADLAAPGPRVPLTADPALFSEASALGKELIRLQTFGERFPEAPGIDGVHRAPGVGWHTAVSNLPEDLSEVAHDAAEDELTIGDGVLSGVTAEVWNYEVSGWRVVRQWIGSRTRKGIGRAASQKTASYLDQFRPDEWEDAWNDEMVELISVLTFSLAKQPDQADLLKRIHESPQIPLDQLPTPTAAERAVPK